MLGYYPSSKSHQINQPQDSSLRKAYVSGNFMTTMKQTILALTFAVFGLTACNNSSRQSNTKNKTTAVDTSTSSIAITNTSDNDTITYDRSYFPVDSFSTKVLTVGTFHEDEVWKSAKNDNWFGVFKGRNGCYISQTKIKTVKVFDPVLDEDSLKNKTGWYVEAINKDTCIILLAGLDFLSSRQINQAVLSKDQLFPGDTLRINYSGIDYKIFATGGKNKVQDDPEWFDVWNYKLYLAARIKGQLHKSLLVAQPNFDDQMIDLIFAGDIDGDGILDLIIDTSRHYNATSPTIYLSRPADNGEVVKPMGGHTSVGC